LSSGIRAIHATSGTGVRAPSTTIGSSTSWASGLLAARNYIVTIALVIKDHEVFFLKTFASHGVIEQARSVFGLSGVSFLFALLATAHYQQTKEKETFNALIVAPTTVSLGETTVTILLFSARSC